MALANLYRHSPVGCFEHCIALVLKILARQVANATFIFNQENCFQTRLSFGRQNAGFSGNCLSRCAHAWEIDIKRGTLARFARDSNESPALLDDAIDGRESKSSSLLSFRSEERLKDVQLDCPIHAHTGVANHKHHVFPFC